MCCGDAASLQLRGVKFGVSGSERKLILMNHATCYVKYLSQHERNLFHQKCLRFVNSFFVFSLIKCSRVRSICSLATAGAKQSYIVSKAIKLAHAQLSLRRDRCLALWHACSYKCVQGKTSHWVERNLLGHDSPASLFQSFSTKCCCRLRSKSNYSGPHSITNMRTPRPKNGQSVRDSLSLHLL